MPRWFRKRCSPCALACSVAFFACATLSPALADDGEQPRTTFGTVGLIEMPSARMAPDGQLSAAASVSQHTERYDLNFQALPWLETSLRYTGLSHFEPAGSAFYSVYWDRSFAIKARLFEETAYTPAIALGINDIIGTGVYSSEYLVASKRFGAIDTTLGMGWGRLGSTELFTNPFAALFPSFKTRPSLTLAGGTDFNAFFHGEKVGLFGGAVWHTPIDGLALSIEYSSDKQTLESTLGTFAPPKTQINYGVSYQAYDDMTVGLAWLYGKTVAATISIQADPTTTPYAAKITPDLPVVHVRTPEEQQQALEILLRHGVFASTGEASKQAANAERMNKDAFVDRLMSSDGYDDVEIRGRAIILSAESDQTLQNCRALAGLAQSYGGGFDAIVLQSGPRPTRRTVRCEVPATLQNAAFAPPAIDASPDDPRAGDAAAVKAIRRDLAIQDIQVEALSLTASEAIVYYDNKRYFAEDEAVGRLTRVLMNDAPPRIEKFRLVAEREREFDVLRAPLERAFAQGGGAELFGSAVTLVSPRLNDPVLTNGQRGTFPRYSWNLFPQFRQSFFDPENPLGVELVAGLEGDVELLPGLFLGGVLEADLYDDFPNRPSNSVLPHVRSDTPLYVHDGGNGIASLMADYKFRLAPNVFAQVKAGYLESMFAGVGGEVLWRPEGQRWALGADLYEVKQRDFDRLFGLQDYHVTTGHITVYYQSPWYDLNFQLRAGQYLAGDRGFTFQMTRRFSTGVEVGAFFTKTNVSAEQFGEGGFDKGIIIRIPLGWALPIETQGEFSLALRPLQRDGGQPLAGDATLYDEYYRTSEGEIDRHSDTFINP